MRARSDQKISLASINGVKDFRELIMNEEKTMSQTNISIRMDENLKRDFNAVCSEKGFTMSAAFIAFAKDVTKKRVIPFDITSDILPSDVTLASERALAKEWLLPEEDEAWANL
jgi:DNA-damage-inducible protein J